MRTSSLPFRLRTSTVTLTILTVCLTGGASDARADQPVSTKLMAVTVRCGAGQSVRDALRRAERGATIHIHGTCRERVLVTQPVTLDGGGSAVIDGAGLTLPPLPGVDPELDGLIVAVGVRNVNIVGVTVRNGASGGILALHGASLVLRNVMAQNNAMVGFGIGDNSTVQAIDSETRSNGVGFDVFTSSSLILGGTFVTSGNTIHGGVINGQSIVELRGKAMTASDNAAVGILVGSRSQLAVFGFQSAQTSTLTVSGNGFAGVVIADSALTVFNTTVVTATNNGVGLFVASGQVTIPSANATVALHGNGVGMNMSGGSSALLIGGLNVHDNTTGLLVDESSLSLEAAPGLPAAVMNNGINIQLAFGARSTIQNVTIGTPLVCDATVLSRGTTTCP